VPFSSTTDRAAGNRFAALLLGDFDHRKQITSGIGPSVWTGRALQAKNDDVELIGLALLYPALDGTFVFLAIMDIRARSISLATRPRRP